MVAFSFFVWGGVWVFMCALTVISRLSVRVISVLVATSVCSSTLCLGFFQSDKQEQVTLSGQEDFRAVIQALQQIDRDYTDFLAKRTRIKESYLQTLRTLQESEQDLRQIGNEAIRQQMAAFQAKLQSLRMDEMMNASRRRSDGLDNPANRRPNGGLASQNPMLKRLTQDALAQEKTMAELQFSLRAAELQQLDATSQAVVRRRLENLQVASGLEREFVQWQNDWSKFMDRYWLNSDFQRSWNVLQIQETLKLLQLAHHENYAAMLTAARLKCRIGLFEDALVLADKVLEADTSLNSIATAIKAEVLQASGKAKEANKLLQSALKTGKDNIYVRWIRAEQLTDQKQYKVVESIWRSFLSESEFELPARRHLAMLYFNRALGSTNGRGKADFSKAVEEAELGLELEAKPRWQAHLVYGIALYGVGKNEEALGHIAKAKNISSDDALDLCKEWEQRIKDGEAIPWEFIRIFESE